MPSKSITLLQEGLEEIQQLAGEAKRKNPVIYENARYTPFDIILLEAEDDDQGFLDRTTAAIEKVKKAGEAGVKELSDLQKKLAAAGMQNSEEAVNRARVALEKAIPGQSFMGSLSSLAGGAVSALFGKEDDPVEKVTEIVADAARYQQMLGNVMKVVTDMLADIKPEAAVENAEEEAGTELDPEAEKQWIEEFKAQIMNASIDKILNSDDDPFPEVRDAFPGFNEKAIKDAIKKSVKPAKWFAGLKKVSGALGIGLGGDLPFKKFGLKIDGVLQDVGAVQISEFQKVAGSIKPDSKDEKIVQDTTAAAGELGDLKQDLPDVQAAAAEKEEKSSATAPGGKPAADGGAAAAGSEEGSGGATTPDPKAAAYLKIVQSVPGVREPESAADKLAQLLAAGFSYIPSIGLRNLLSEKVLRYDDVVSSLSDHLPEDEAEIPAAVKKLADEMKVELGSEFDIVGLPDTAGEELAALRSEIEALRRMIQGLPEDEREGAVDDITSNLEDETGLPSDVIDDLVDPDSPIDDLLDEIPEDNIDDLEDAIPDDPEDLVPEDEGPAVGDFYSYEIKTGKNQGKTIGVKVAEITNNGDSVSLFRPSADGSKFTNQKFGVKIDALGEKLEDEAAALELSKEAAAGDDAEESSTPPSPGEGSKSPKDTAVELNKLKNDLDATADQFEEILKDMKPDGQVLSRKGFADGFVRGFEEKNGKVHVRVTDETDETGKVTSVPLGKTKFVYKESASFSNKDRLAQVAVSKMRGFILRETNDFRYASNLTPKQVVQEFYSLGGKNRDILNERKSITTDRWQTIAGLQK